MSKNLQGIRKKVYLAGPMRGLTGWNVAAFDLAERAWTEGGWQVFSPAAIVRAYNYATDGPAEPGNAEGAAHLQHVILSDIVCLTHSDAIALLPGWERSRGATVELAVAQFLGLEVYDAVTQGRIYPPMTPWGLTVDLSADVKMEEGWQEAWRALIDSQETRFAKAN